VQTEIEAKFLSVDHESMRVKLRSAGAVCKNPERLMSRKNYDFPDMRLGNEKRAWVRVRNEGDKVTMSYKQLDDRGLHGTKEINLTIDSFEQADAFLEAIGLKMQSYQETKRESWSLGDVDIELDEWPWTEPYLEMEGPDEASLRKVADQLGLTWSEAVHGSVEVVYRAEYDVTDEQVDAIPVITFETPLPEVLSSKRRKA
jgi:adenylate cyclase class 2